MTNIVESINKFLDKLTIVNVLLFLFVFVGLYLFSSYIAYSFASSICTESKVVPFRYESVGLFGTLTKIQTTEENADGHARLCVKTASGEPSLFSIDENLEFLVRQSKENSENGN